MAVTPTEAHLADLHALAAAEGVEGYRKLTKQQLAEELENRLGAETLAERLEQIASGDFDLTAAGSRSAPVESRESRSTPGRKRRSEEKTPEPVDAREGDGEEEVSGLAHLRGQGARPFGFVYPGGSGRTDEAAYISDALVAEFGIRTADRVRGKVVTEEDGRRVLETVDEINGVDPSRNLRRPDFDGALRIPPQLRDMIVPLRRDVVGRSIALLAPFVRGQRSTVAGGGIYARSEMLRAIGSSLLIPLRARIVVAAVSGDFQRDEFWQILTDTSPAECFAEPGSDLPRRFAALALAIERAKRIAESRHDVILIVDGAEELREAAAGGPVTGDERQAIESLGTLSKVLPGGGSVTVLDSVAELPEGYAETVIAVSDGWAEPAVDPLKTRLGNEIFLREPGELAQLTNLRDRIAGMHTAEATAWLIRQVESTTSNYQLLNQL